MNSLSINVENWEIANSTPQSNTAGLLYKLTVTAQDCGNEAPTPTTLPTPTSLPTSTPPPTQIPTEIPTPTDMPAPTIVPSPTSVLSAKISLILFLHGIGKAGDSVSQGIGTVNPLHPQRKVKIDLYNSQNVLVKTVDGEVVYASPSGDFRGTADLGIDLATGAYSIKVKADQYLKRLVPGIQNLTQGSMNNLPAAFLTAGDINGDNAVNIVDYHILMGCYSDLSAASDCSGENKVLADITDDGEVNQFDYNLFIREISNLVGQ
jgi:hypothetical protein